MMQVIWVNILYMGQIKTKSGCQIPALLFITAERRGGGDGKFYFELFSFFKEWVVFVLLPPFGIYRTYCPINEIKITSFYVTLELWG